MWLLVLIAVGVVLWAWIRYGQAMAKAAPRQARSTVVSVSAAPTVSPKEEVEWKPVDGGFVLGANLPQPLTLLGLSAADAKKLARALEADNSYEIRDWLVEVVARENMRCKELDDWVALSKPKFEAAVEQAKQASEGWAGASERDREDYLADFQERAARELPVRPADVEATLALLTQEPGDLTVDDKLLSRFRNEPQLYQALLWAFAGGRRVQALPVGAYRRKEFEELAARGYLRRGADIPIDDILASLTLKEMTEVAGEAAPKKFTRKAPAIEFLKTLPDLTERLGRVVALRELFQAAPPTDVDVDAVAASYRYAGRVAELITQTLESGVRSLHDRVVDADFEPTSWKLSSEDCCPQCQADNGKTWRKAPSRRPPFHIGCTSSLWSM